MSGPDPAQGRPTRTAPRPEGATGAPTAPTATSAAERATDTTTAQLRRFGRRYPATGRVVVSVLCTLAGPFAAPPEGAGVAAVAAAGVVAWNVAYLAMVLPDRHGPPRPQLVYGVDLVLLCGLCLAQPLLVDPALLAASLGWVSPIASFTLVALQFQVRALPAAVATVAVCAAYVAGTALSPGLTVRDGLLAGGAWMLVEALLARVLWMLLLRGGAEADRLLQARFAAEQAAQTAAARRADQRAHWATVHDTAASTLLMVGLGEVAGTEAWLPGQVQRDIALLDGRRDGDSGDADLGAVLRATVARARVRVELECPEDVTLPAPVATALAGAAAEALENVRRHAGTDVAALVVHAGPGVEVLVIDAGRGFDPGGVGPQRLGLAWSVHDRMDAVGGHAEVESAPGRGTTVRLRWPA